MKILCEVPLQVGQHEQSQFRWLRGPENFLFAFEDKRRLRVFAIRQDAAHEVQSAALAETRHCTSLSWNKDESLLALVVDKRQVYIWEVRRNSFTQFRPRSVSMSSGGGVGGGSGHQPTGATATAATNLSGAAPQRPPTKASKSIEFVAWSKLSNKLAICYASGQILLCELAPAAAGAAGAGFVSVWERFIDNSESVLKQIVSIEVAEQAELFVCFSAISEILIMTFDGHTAFYSQGDRAHLFNAKFSPLRREHCPRTGHYLGQTICLAYQSEHDALLTKTISLDAELEFYQSSPPVVHSLHSGALTSTTFDNDQQPPADRRDSSSSHLVDFHWLGPARLLLCFASGCIQMIQFQAGVAAAAAAPNGRQSISPPSPLGGAGAPDAQGSQHILCTELLRLDAHSPASPHDSSSLTGSISPPSPPLGGATEHSPSDSAFKIFEMIETPKRPRTLIGDTGSAQSFALALGTSYQLHYYELLIENSTNGTATLTATSGGGSGGEFSLEHFDDIDLGESLRRLGLRLERAAWASDCSMLVLQLTSGHLLVYRTRLQDFLVASHGPRTAYLSAAHEITILNYETSLASGAGADETLSQASGNSHPQQQQARAPENALILSVRPLRPSLLAIGPTHLALALNNRVRFYPLNRVHVSSTNATSGSRVPDDQTGSYHEREYAAIVAAVGLSARFAAVQFDDGRLKLHPMGGASSATNDPERDAFDDECQDERLFPDPSRPERVSAFALTQELLVYCTSARQVVVFCLRTWRPAQVCDHSRVSAGREPVWRLRPSARGNKFVCLLEPTARDESKKLSDRRSAAAAGLARTCNAFLYDLYSNSVYEIAAFAPLSSSSPLWPELLARQVQLTRAKLLSWSHSEAGAEQNISQKTNYFSISPNRPYPIPKMTAIVDAVWDTDGRTVLLIEPRLVHAFAVLDHTLEREAPVVEYAASARKPASYTTLYACQGIVSYQTALGRVVNSILETHDDELKLTQLEARIQAIKRDIEAAQQGSLDDHLANDDDDDDEAERATNGSTTGELSQITQQQQHLEVALAKVSYLATLLPIYPLGKCRDICKHLMEDEAFNLAATDHQVVPSGEGCSTSSTTKDHNQHHRHTKIIDQLPWRVLAAWALFTLNLDFASLLYRRNQLEPEASKLGALLNSIRAPRSNMTRSEVRHKCLALLNAAGHSGRAPD